MAQPFTPLNSFSLLFHVAILFIYKIAVTTKAVLRGKRQPIRFAKVQFYRRAA